MRWSLSNDHTAPVITAEKHIHSRHGDINACSLPKTCVIFEMGKALPFLEANFETMTLMEKLPCFIADSKCIAIKGNPDVCFVRGGYGAPAAVDTLETVRALGVRRVIVAGMCGGFSDGIKVGDVVIPHKVLCEEGTSHHYFEDIEFVTPDSVLFEQASSHFAGKFSITTDTTVTSDAFYRQTFAKEAAWRIMGCIGVDMESSALLSVSRYYTMPAVSILLCSDKHPIDENDAGWDWGDNDFKTSREEFVHHVAAFAKHVEESCFRSKFGFEGDEPMDLIKAIDEIVRETLLSLGKPEKFLIADRSVPHRPEILPPGMMGVCTFWHNDIALKIGMAGPKSNPRFFSHHYNPNSNQSNLAKSILLDKGMDHLGISEANVGAWIKKNCRRIDILLDQDLGIETLKRVKEALLKRYEPRYEGSPAKRKNSASPPAHERGGILEVVSIHGGTDGSVLPAISELYTNDCGQAKKWSMYLENEFFVETPSLCVIIETSSREGFQCSKF